MACDLTAGRLLDCKDAVGGIRSVLFLEVADYTPTYTGNILSAVAAATAYRYELPKGTGSLSEAITVSTEAGSIFYEDTLTIKLHKLSAADRDEVKLLAQNRLVCFVLDNNNDQWCMGEVNGADLTAGTAATGMAYGDLSGFELTFMSQEAEPMRNAGTYTTNPFDNITGLTVSPAY
tara:strand:- start:24 stop:554 length:531 start_codon:yes stop_codon:yes gene_type:complete